MYQDTSPSHEHDASNSEQDVASGKPVGIAAQDYAKEGHEVDPAHDRFARIWVRLS